MGTLELSVPVELTSNHDLFLPWTAFGSTLRQGAATLKKLFKSSTGVPTILTYVYNKTKGQPTECTLCNMSTAMSISWNPGLHPQAGGFPAWRRVLPNLDNGEYKPTHAIGYNLMLMASYFSARYTRCTTSGGDFVPSVLTGNLGATVFTDRDDSTFLGLIMPLRMVATAEEMRKAISEKLSALRATS